MARILIIEDEIEIAELEKDYLEMSGFDVEICEDGSEGLKKALEESYNLVIVDIMLPGADGYDICREIRKEKNVPVIMVSAKKDDIDKVFLLGCESAALTHGNNNAIIPAGVLASIINKIVYTNKDLKNIILESINLVKKHFKNDTEDLIALLYSAVQCSFSNDTDIEVIEKLGEGWHGDEALAIAIYCALKYHDDFESALVAAVNHSGDSDSTGAVTGNIIGCLLGIESIPNKYIENLEMKDLIFEMAEKLI